MRISNDWELNLNNEQKLIIKILQLKGDYQPVTQIQEIIDHNFNWNLWLDLVKNHGVAPLVYRNCQKYLPDVIPSDIINHLDFFYRQNTARNLALSSELVKIITILQQHQIITLPYKGPVLSQYLYQDFTLRCSTDLDLIIPESDLHKVKNILCKANYQLSSVFNQNLALNPPLQWQSEYLMSTSNGKILIDIHKKITRDDLFYPLSMNHIWQDLTTINFLGKDLAYFDVNKLFFILATHGTKHCWESLNWLYDLVSFINNKKDLDLDKVISLAQQNSHLRMILLTLGLCEKLFEIAISPHIQQLIAEDKQIPDLIFQSCQNLFKSKGTKKRVTFEDNFMSKLFFFLKLQDTYQGKFKQLLALTKYLFSPNLRDWDFYPLPENLYFLYYLIRPFRLTNKLIFKFPFQ